jgi:hypothetical protein
VSCRRTPLEIGVVRRISLAQILSHREYDHYHLASKLIRISIYLVRLSQKPANFFSNSCRLMLLSRQHHRTALYEFMTELRNTRVSFIIYTYQSTLGADSAPQHVDQRYNLVLPTSGYSRFLQYVSFPWNKLSCHIPLRGAFTGCGSYMHMKCWS